MGIYLLVCLGFVICALARFAITILIHQRRKSKDKHLSETKSTHETYSPVRSQITKVCPEPEKWEPGTAEVTTDAKDHIASILPTQILQRILIIPATEIIDFIAIWIYLLVFLVFNYIYWSSHLNQSAKSVIIIGTQ